MCCADFCAVFCAQILAQISADFASTFWRFKNRSSRVAQKSAQNLRKICDVPTAFLHLGCLELTTCHTIAARPKHSRRACECPLWLLGAQRPACVCSKFFFLTCENPLCDPVASTWFARNFSPCPLPSQILFWVCSQKNSQEDLVEIFASELSGHVRIRICIPRCIAATAAHADAPKNGFLLTLEWSWLESQESPRNGQDVHVFQVGAPICRMVAVIISCASPPPATTTHDGLSLSWTSARNPFVSQKATPFHSPSFPRTEYPGVRT